MWLISSDFLIRAMLLLALLVWGFSKTSVPYFPPLFHSVSFVIGSFGFRAAVGWDIFWAHLNSKSLFYPLRWSFFWFIIGHCRMAGMSQTFWTVLYCLNATWRPLLSSFPYLLSFYLSILSALLLTAFPPLWFSTFFFFFPGSHVSRRILQACPPCTLPHLQRMALLPRRPTVGPAPKAL